MLKARATAGSSPLRHAAIKAVSRRGGGRVADATALPSNAPGGRGGRGGRGAGGCVGRVGGGRGIVSGSRGELLVRKVQKIEEVLPSPARPVPLPPLPLPVPPKEAVDPIIGEAATIHLSSRKVVSPILSWNILLERPPHKRQK